ncbi:hypothetical protein Tco_1548624 [Tanacetum coccineum]
MKEDEDAVKRIQGQALKEKNDPGAFIFLIRLEGKVNENAMADTGSDMNIMPYRIYKQLGRDDFKNKERGITMIDHTQAEAMGKLSNEHTMTKPDHHDPNAQDTKLWKNYCFYKFTMSFCYEKDAPKILSLVCADDELQSKKIIRFRLGGRTHSLTLLKFARRLGLYQAVELEDDGFNVYFEERLCSDDNFNAMNYWLSISREENLSLSKSHTSTIRCNNPSFSSTSILSLR